MADVRRTDTLDAVSFLEAREAVASEVVAASGNALGMLTARTAVFTARVVPCNQPQ